MRRSAALAFLLLACSGTRQAFPPPEQPRTDAARQDPPAQALPCEGPAVPETAPWYATAVFYEIFVRSFRDSDGDGIGDLRGVVERLDYLEGLGVTALWLMPINKSPSYHGYDVTDYRAINPDYGAIEDFEALASEADKRGIKVVLDLVMNHSSNKHPWFVKGKRGPGQEFSDRYVWSDTKLGWSQPWNPGSTTWHQAGVRWYYGLFTSGMPDLNHANPEVQAEFQDIGSFWLDKGAAGFRLDAARYLVETGGGDGQADQPATHAAWKALRAHLAKDHPDHLLVGEVWTDLEATATYFGQGDELHMLFGFDRSDATRKALRLGASSGLAGQLCAELKATPATGQGAFGSFLTNHDLDRLATDVAHDPAALKLSATLLLTLPGVPFVYYGEELGLSNGPATGDIAKRLPMRWDETDFFGFSEVDPWSIDEGSKSVAPVSVQAADPASLLEHYRAVIALRRAHPALSSGATRRVTAESKGGSVFAVLRTRGDTRILVVANLGKTTATELKLGVTGASEALLGSWPASEMAPRAAAVIKLE